MYRYCVAYLALAFLGGCAASPSGPEVNLTAADAAADSAPPTGTENSVVGTANGQGQALAAPGAVTPVNIQDFQGETVCEPITATGTRMVVEKRCYTRSKNDKLAAERAANTRLKMEELRHSQEMGERAQRDAEERRQTASMRSAFP
jgi:hypothetical protein